MPDYSSSKIYMLRSSDGYYYYGSTINTLAQRWREHKCMSKKHPDMKVYTHIDFETGTIELVEAFVCASRNELLAKENEYIKKAFRDEKCLNSQYPMPDEDRKEEVRLGYLNRAKEWYENNKERKSEYDKAYREKNKEKRRLQSKKYYQSKKSQENKDERVSANNDAE